MTKKIIQTTNKRKAAPTPAKKRAISQPDAREKLLAATRQVIAKDGFSEASVKAIARKAGVNHGLVHYHFGGKEQMLLESFVQGNYGLEGMRELRAKWLPKDYVRGACAMTLLEIKEQPDMFRIGAQLSAQSLLPGAVLGKQVRKYMKSAIQELAELLAATHNRKPTKRDVAIALVLNGGASAIAHWSLRDPTADATAALSVLEEIIERALLPEKVKTPSRKKRA
ncbi:TetR/AcrR family transcriptional regulator [Stenotrophobium rhamnosiphilum]|uniref:HTH tetR-type domain-containing protein n=1 Tax=Stenotrophobium rhamnosiphilum TaxID=2029166 RepID=A0A2T5MCM5_9GAMM|nr:TetR/AcrR family transcriptional regulator [Stenotrophobium rhamnosiphilum]PTU30320.1 hypothetical protein CJD38_15350 [Stenotrophobium rhamnosiphilum]